MVFNDFDPQDEFEQGNDLPENGQGALRDILIARLRNINPVHQIALGVGVGCGVLTGAITKDPVLAAISIPGGIVATEAIVLTPGLKNKLALGFSALTMIGLCNIGGMASNSLKQISENGIGTLPGLILNGSKPQSPLEKCDKENPGTGWFGKRKLEEETGYQACVADEMAEAERQRLVDECARQKGAVLGLTCGAMGIKDLEGFATPDPNATKTPTVPAVAATGTPAPTPATKATQVPDASWNPGATFE